MFFTVWNIFWIIVDGCLLRAFSRAIQWTHSDKWFQAGNRRNLTSHFRGEPPRPLKQNSVWRAAHGVFRSYVHLRRIGTSHNFNASHISFFIAAKHGESIYFKKRARFGQGRTWRTLIARGSLVHSRYKSGRLQTETQAFRGRRGPKDNFRVPRCYRPQTKNRILLFEQNSVAVAQWPFLF